MARRSGSTRPRNPAAKPTAKPAVKKSVQRAGWVYWLALVLLIAALLGQLRHTIAKLGASRALNQVELRTKMALSAGRSSRILFSENLQILRRAAELDPLEPGVPIARGAQHLLLGSAEAAEEAYIDALRIEPKPEIYLNLGRAQLLAGTPTAARQSFATAVTLDPNLAAYIPAAGR
jgi:tetratricopeptide (TPR) repeat protein